MSDSDNLAAFVKYATAFEEGFAADDWGLVNVMFDDRITWAVGGLPSPEPFVAEGRENVSAIIKRSVDAFDRRFDRSARVRRASLGARRVGRAIGCSMRRGLTTSTA